MNRCGWRTWFTLAAGLPVSGFFLWLALRQVDPHIFAAAFTSANYLFILASAAALAVGLALRAVRWRVVAGAPFSAHSSFYRATTIGALSNMVLPARAGEFVRIFTLAKLSDARLAKPVASALLDRLVDMFVLMVSALALYLYLPLFATMDKWLITIITVGAIVVLGLIVFLRVVGIGQGWLSRVCDRWLREWKLRPDVFFCELHSEIKTLLCGWSSIKLILIMLLILAADCTAIGAQLWAFHLQLPISATLVLWVFLAAGSMLPSAPGYIGIYQTAAVWGLSFFSVPASSAVAVAVTLQITTLAVTFFMTGPSFWRFPKLVDGI